jgi:hypothetical protein
MRFKHPCYPACSVHCLFLALHWRQHRSETPFMEWIQILWNFLATVLTFWLVKWLFKRLFTVGSLTINKAWVTQGTHYVSSNRQSSQENWHWTDCHLCVILKFVYFLLRKIKGFGSHFAHIFCKIMNWCKCFEKKAS